MKCKFDFNIKCKIKDWIECTTEKASELIYKDKKTNKPNCKKSD